jgi:hypothetical protein
MSRTVIDHANDTRYDHVQTSSEIGVRMNRPARRSNAELRAAVAAGEWLSPGEVAALFGKKRHSAINWMKTEKLAYRKDPNGYRECRPESVLALLAEFDTIHGLPVDGEATTNDEAGPTA